MKIKELKYSNTNTYLIEGEKGNLLFDTGWAGTFPQFCKTLKEQGHSVQDIDYILISHFHPDHYGIAEEIAEMGPTIIVMDVQKDYVHFMDYVFQNEGNISFRPVNDSKTRLLDIKDSRSFLDKLGIKGEVIHTPGHSDDSVSLWLDEGAVLVGDLNPLYELELHEGTQIYESWVKLMGMDPVIVYYGHAKTFRIKEDKKPEPKKLPEFNKEEMAKKIIKLVNKGYNSELIRQKTGADETFIEDVTRMYLTHPGVSVQGILDRIEIKGR